MLSLRALHAAMATAPKTLRAARATTALLGRADTAAPSASRSHFPLQVAAFSTSDRSSSSNNSRRALADLSFQELGINARIEQALQEMGIRYPTGIQQKSIDAILAHKDVLCTAQTGTGKTLAYLVPVAEQILRAEAALTDGERLNVRVARPQALVLTPSRELATQVSDVAKRLAHSAKFATATVTSGERKSIQQQKLAKRLDLVVGTPGRVAKCIASRDFFVSRIQTVVVDEADTLFDAKMGFRKELDAILAPIQASALKRGQPLQIVLIAATVQSPLDTVLLKRFGNLQLVRDRDVHQTPALLHESFVRVTPETKHAALRDALSQRAFNSTANRGEKTIVFCQNAASCRATDHMLRESGAAHSLCLHGGMPPALRLASVERFERDPALTVLVCTDLAARGLDFAAVRHVVMFDFPRSAVDYVHRAGRTGRAGVKGFVTSLVSKYDLPLANSIMEANRHRRAVTELRTDRNSSEHSAIPLERSSSSGDDAEPRRRSAKKEVRGRAAVGTKKLKQHKIRSFVKR